MFFQGCIPNKQSKPITQDEYDVYSVLIKSYVVYALKYYNIPDSCRFILIHHNAIKGVIYDGHRQNDTSLNLKKYSISKEWDLLITKYMSICNDTSELDGSRFTVPVKCVLDTAKNSVNNRRSTNGVAGYSFSRVAFNSKNDEALVYFSSDIFEGGGDYTVLLNKQNNHWSIGNGIGWSRGWFPEFGLLLRKTLVKPSVGVPVPIPDFETVENDTLINSAP